MGNTHVVHMLFDSNNIRIHLFATCIFNSRHGISYVQLHSFCRHMGADFIGRFLAGCCHKENINITVKSSTLN